MPTFNNNPDLFASGPSRLSPGPVALRTAEQDAPYGSGPALLSQGTRARTIDQRGRLNADDPAALYELMDAIEGLVDGHAYTLSDDEGRAWPGCVMTVFEPGPLIRRGPRVCTDYRILYIQVLP